MAIVAADPALDSVAGFTGGRQRNSAVMFLSLKPLAERKASIDEVIGRLRGKLSHEPGASLFLVAAQDVRVGGRQSNAQFRYTLQADELADLRHWEPRIRRALSQLPELLDVNTDQQDKGLKSSLFIDRNSASRLGLDLRTIDATLNDAFGQRQVSTLYNPLNPYRVVMELAPPYLQNPRRYRPCASPGVAGQPAPADPGRNRGHLHRPGHPLREPRPSAHHPVDPGLGRGRRAAGPDGLQDRVQRHRPDRRAAPHRHRQEERHHSTSPSSVSGTSA